MVSVNINPVEVSICELFKNDVLVFSVNLHGTRLYLLLESFADQFKSPIQFFLFALSSFVAIPGMILGRRAFLLPWIYQV